jgi:4-oxalocrotonate tautomerase
MIMPIVEISLLAGRSKETKVALIKAVTDAVASTVGAPLESIRVILREVPPEHWGVGGVTKG